MGYDYTPDSLSQMASTLRTSGAHLAQSTRAAPPSPDAGDGSSQLLAEVIGELLRSGSAIVSKQDSIADKIHASKGAYDDVENTNEGQFKVDSRHIQNSDIK